MTPEQSNRYAKASALADVLQKAGVVAGDTVSDESWNLAAAQVAVETGRSFRAPSKETRALTMWLIADREATAAMTPDDLFAEAGQ